MTGKVSSSKPLDFQLSRRVFLRLIGVTYLIAFTSLLPQILGLIGTQGLLPVEEYLSQAHDFFGSDAYYQFPTFLWLSASDTAVLAITWTGIIASTLVILGVFPIGLFALLWMLYLSLTIAGQSFLAFQWDILLLETGLLACLYSPWGWWPRPGRDSPVSGIVRWLVWALAFKLTFLSGITKLVSGDPTWAGLTALTFHYQTQPLPTSLGWYAHNLPSWVHIGTTAFMFFIELIVPFIILVPSRLRRIRGIACLLLCGLQIAIAATGNYGFFNLLTIALYMSLLDDATLRQFIPSFGKTRKKDETLSVTAPKIWRVALITVTPVIACISFLTILEEIDTRPFSENRSYKIVQAVRPIRSINGYGLFRVMTTTRPEIIIEVSQDEVSWHEQEFRWKPTDISQHPRLAQPHMPRLDWQMWFAALDPAGNEHWLRRLMDKLLTDSTAVVSLLGDRSSPDTSPRYVRLAIYQYRYTTPAERDRTKNWWKRELMGYLTESISLENR